MRGFVEGEFPEPVPFMGNLQLYLNERVESVRNAYQMQF